MMCILAEYHYVFHIRDKRGGVCATLGGNRDTYRCSVGKSEGKRPLERPRRKLEDNIELDI
jgi:hypothetical protein